MKFYRLCYFVFFIAGLVSLASCSQSGNLKVGVLLPNGVDERFVNDRQYLEARIKALGATMLFAEAGNDEKKQIEQSNELIAQGAQVLIVASINKISASEIVRNAHEAGIKVVAFDRIIIDKDLDCFVSFDNVKVGEVMAKYAIKKFPQGNFMVLNGDKRDQNAIWVNQGFNNVIEGAVKQGSIKIVYDTYIEDWSLASSRNEVYQYVNSTSTLPDVILSAYDGLSSGAIEAFMESNVKVPAVVTGQNAELLACQNIVKGNQSMTVYKPTSHEAQATVDIAIKMAKGESVKLNQKVNVGMAEIPSILLDPIVVDNSNLRSTVIADGFLKEKDVYGF
jgi:D-xylose transport system substrate-binding protein